MDYYRKYAMSQWLARSDLTLREQVVWQVLNERQGSREYSWASLAELAEATGLDSRHYRDGRLDTTAIRRVLRSLRQKMYLVSRRRGTGRRGKSQNIYAVCIPSEWERVSERVDSLSAVTTLSAQCRHRTDSLSAVTALSAQCRHRTPAQCRHGTMHTLLPNNTPNDTGEVAKKVEDRVGAPRIPRRAPRDPDPTANPSVDPQNQITITDPDGLI